VLSILPGVITWAIALVLIVKVLTQPKDGRQNGRGLAIAALTVIGGWIVVIIAIVAVVLAAEPDRDSTGAVKEEGTVVVTGLRVGDCLPETPGSEAQTTVTVIPCDSPHVQEVYANFDVPESTSSQDDIDRLAEGGCIERFPAFAQMAYDESVLEVVYLRPLGSSLAVDNGVTCMVSEGPATTGTLKNARR